MSRIDFLEILRDYLKGSFSQLEINDILRDYEEFFLNGELQGKSDEEIIANLGSPKNIAKELIMEIKGEGKENLGSENFKSKVSKDTKNLWKNVKKEGKKAGNKTKKFLDSNFVLNENISGAGVKIIMIIISILLFFPSLCIAFWMIASGFGLIGMSIGNFAGYIVSAFLCGIELSVGIFGFFACIAWTGFIILGWTIYSLIYKGLKYLVVKYISWFKTRNMYVRVKNQQENYKEKQEETVDMNSESNDTDITETNESIKNDNVDTTMVNENIESTYVDTTIIDEDLNEVIDVDCEENKEEEEDEIHE